MISFINVKETAHQVSDICSNVLKKKKKARKHDWASGFCIMIMHLSRWSSVKQSLADNQINALEHPTHKVLPHETLHVSNMRILLKESHFEFIEDIHTM